MGDVDVGLDEIKRILPHRSPFLFVDRVVELEENKRILALRELRPEEPHFEGHFPGEAIMPGVLITEALAQTAGLLHGLSAMKSGKAPAPGQLFYLARADMKWTSPVRPGETLMLEARLVRSMGALFAFRVRAFTRQREVAAGSLTIAEAQEKKQGGPHGERI
jgi:3-hydroxyacyl-[acyl-carrier-protein] dehydratase